MKFGVWRSFIGAPTYDVGATMDPHHHWETGAGIQGGRPDVQKETILAHFTGEWEWKVNTLSCLLVLDAHST